MAIRLFIALSLLLLISNPAYAQTANAANRTASLEGNLIMPTSQAMERYEVLLLSKDGEQVLARTNADLSGRYRFTNLAPDNVDVVARIDGFDEVRTPVKLTVGRSMTVNIFLTAKSKPEVYSAAWDSSVVQIDELTRKFPKKAVDDFQKAAESKRKGDIARALELLEGVVKLSPDFYDAHNLLGTLYQGLDRYRDAEKQYNLSRNLNPTSVTPLVNLAVLYLKEAEANEKEGPFVTGVMYDDSLHVLQDATKLDPRNATVYYLFGVLFYRAHSYRYAEASFNEALSIDEHYGASRLALANVYIRLQKWKEALDQFDMYLAENPRATDRTQVEAIRAKVIQQL